MKYELLSNNSMALSIRYKKTSFFETLDCVSNESYGIRGSSDFILFIGAYFIVTNFFVFTPKGA